MNELSNFDLTDIITHMKLDKHFDGIYSKDQLPKELIRGKFYIINLQDHDKGDGTHWTVFYYNKPLTSVYFDSYGFIAPQDVQNKITPYIFNDAEIQDFNSSACGYFCITLAQSLKQIIKACISLCISDNAIILFISEFTITVSTIYTVIFTKIIKFS